MKLRALLLLALASPACASPAQAAAQAARPGQGARVLLTRFQFDAGAPLAAPAGIADDGTWCVGTVDGYVHSLNPDGSFRWSHTVHGAVNRRPLHAGDLWYLVSNSDRLYALHEDGSLAWVFKPPSPIASELGRDDTGMAYYVGKDRFLYGLSRRGGVSLRREFGDLEAGPSAGADGGVWVRSEAGVVLRLHAGEAQRAVEPTPRLPFNQPGYLVDGERRRWQGRSDGVLEFSQTSEAPAITLALTQAPLFAPAWSALGRYALVSSRNGLVFAVAPGGAPRSR